VLCGAFGFGTENKKVSLLQVPVLSRATTVPAMWMREVRR
jgi:hypothetical protein